MIGYVVRRVLRAVTTLLGTTLLIFVLVRVIPADPAVTIAGPKADPETLAAIRKDLGLDDPVAVQYGRYLAGLARGDLGRSYMTGRPVAGVIIERVAYRRLRNSPRLAPLITAIGVSFFFEGFMLTRAGPDNVPTGRSSWRARPRSRPRSSRCRASLRARPRRGVISTP